MQKRTLKVALLAVVALILVLGFSGSALAATWPDMPDTVTAPYGVTDNQVASISQGFTDGLWRPYQSVTRAQFVKMAVSASHVPLMNPAVATFTDVPKGSHYYQYVEGAVAAGLVLPGTTFGPNVPISRLDATSIMSRWISAAHGIDLATYYTAAEIAGLLAHFGDKASIPAASQALVAFAYDWGITVGDKFGNFNGAGLLTRIQGATFLIRAQAKVPPAMWTADKIEIVSGDKAENLIGKTHTVTFKVTDAAGHPAVGVLVDFDTLYANPLYVGNISPQAAVTDNFGMVSVNLVSHEPGTEKVSATVATVDGGLATQVVTKYWLALDEVYLTDPTMEADFDDDFGWAENNAGDPHTWCFRVVVFGPGPLSSGPNDWYNAYNPDADASDIDNDDAIDAFDEIDGDFDYGDELYLWDEWGLIPRTMAGIGVEFDVDWDLDTPAGGSIVTKDTVTDSDGLACITIKSTSTGDAMVYAIADYPENPYPKQLIDHSAVDPSDWEHNDNWEDQPDLDASAYKLWIPHVIGGDSDAPITPAYAVNNTGEVEEFVLELKDVYGNPIEDYQVEWWIQGVGFFKTDESTWVGVGEQNKDIDETDANGKASVLVKSEDPGQTIVHCKVMDKYGLPWKEWNVVKQWYAVDFVTMDNPLTTADESLAENPVGTSHTFDVWALGWKYVYVLTDVNHNGLRDDAVILGDRADIKKLAGPVLNFDGVTVAYTKAMGEVLPAGRVIVIEGTPYTNYTDASAIEEAIAWVDSLDDGVKEAWHPLQGKGVNFFTNVGQCPNDPISDTPLATVVPGAPDKPYYVGSITGAAAAYPEWTYGGKLYDYDAVTDAGGKASVTIASTAKGYQWVYAVVDYPENPQSGDPTKPTKWGELNWDCAQKLWEAGEGTTIRVFNAAGDPGNEFTNPILPYVRMGIDDETTAPTAAQLELVYGTFRGLDADNPNREVIAVQIFDAYGNSIEGWKVDFQIVDQGKTQTTGRVPTYRPFTHFAEWTEAGVAAHPDLYDWVTPNWPDSGVYDLNPWLNVNPIWNAAMSADNESIPAHPAPDEEAIAPHWYSDADYSWGHTLNGQIDYTESLDSAAYTTLILDESIADLEGYDHVATKVNVKVWNPAGQMVEDFQVEKIWEVPVPTTITLTPTADYAIAGVESQSVVATVLDQFGNPVVGADLGFQSFVDEGTALPVGYVAEVLTDDDGKATLTWTQAAGVWGVQRIAAFWDEAGDNAWAGTELTSNIATIQWIYDDRSAVLPDLVLAYAGEQKVYINAGNPLWPGKSLTTHLNPGAAAIGGPVAYTGVATSMSTGSKTWALNEAFFVAANSNNTDGVPNWVYDVAID